MIPRRARILLLVQQRGEAGAIARRKDHLQIERFAAGASRVEARLPTACGAFPRSLTVCPLAASASRQIKAAAEAHSRALLSARAVIESQRTRSSPQPRSLTKCMENITLRLEGVWAGRHSIPCRSEIAPAAGGRPAGRDRRDAGPTSDQEKMPNPRADEVSASTDDRSKHSPILGMPAEPVPSPPRLLLRSPAAAS